MVLNLVVHNLLKGPTFVEKSVELDNVRVLDGGLDRFAGWNGWCRD